MPGQSQKSFTAVYHIMLKGRLSDGKNCKGSVPGHIIYASSWPVPF
jgi:hypothetical protein